MNKKYYFIALLVFILCFVTIGHQTLDKQQATTTLEVDTTMTNGQRSEEDISINSEENIALHLMMIAQKKDEMTVFLERYHKDMDAIASQLLAVFVSDRNDKYPYLRYRVKYGLSWGDGRGESVPADYPGLVEELRSLPMDDVMEGVLPDTSKRTSDSNTCEFFCGLRDNSEELFCCVLLLYTEDADATVQPWLDPVKIDDHWYICVEFFEAAPPSAPGWPGTTTPTGSPGTLGQGDSFHVPKNEKGNKSTGDGTMC